MWHGEYRQNYKTLMVCQRLQCKLDRLALDEIGTPVSLLLAGQPSTPVVLSSPHCGRNYPKAFQAQSLLSLFQLRQSEDCYIDHLLTPLRKLGIPFLKANFPRILVDVNRSADEYSLQALHHMGDGRPQPTQRARLGFGVVPTRLGLHMDIYPHDICADLIGYRLKTLYRPYHDALKNLLHSAKDQCGHAVLLDCHSMPGSDQSGEKRTDIVLGNRYGAACRPKTIAFIEHVFTSLGYRVRRNDPYAGGFITEHYGRPHMNIEAVQIEINKDLYLNPLSLEKNEGWDKLTNNMQTAIVQINNYFAARDTVAAQ